MNRKYFFIILLFLSLLGFLTSTYLIYNHYSPSLRGSLCDITAAVSCSVINSGIYSKIAGIPVATYGVAWFVMLGLLSGYSWKKESNISKLVWWNVTGLLFVFYFIYIEFLLSTICPLCTVVHVLVLASLVISIILYKHFYKSKLPSNQN